MHNAMAGRFLALSRGFMHSRVFLTAIELGIFRTIGLDRLSAQDLADRVGAEPRALELVLNALVAMSLLEKTDGCFSNIPFCAEEIANHDGESFEAFRHAAYLWERWSDLTRIVFQNPRTAPKTNLDRSGALTMRQYAEGSAHALAQTIGGPDVHRLLDIGGGPGTFSIALAKHFAQLHAVVFDANPQALDIAGKEVAASGLGERVKIRRGNFLDEDLGYGYDCVLLSSVICLLGEAENCRLLRRVRDALLPGGKIVIRDAILDPSGTSPPQFAFFSINMLVTTDKGKCYTHPEVCRWLEKAGFARIRRLPLQDARLIMAVKPDKT
jgi:SAM-dependent methyltransferase